MNAYKRRDKLKIVYDILHTLNEKNGRVKPTHLMYKSNLSHKMMKDYVKELLANRFMIEETSDKESYYIITKKGIDYLNRYHSIVKFVGSFGLEEDD